MASEMAAGAQLESEEIEMQSEVVNKGVGACDLLLIVFIVLKLLKIISWSWVWVLAPLWIPFALVIVVLGVVLIIESIKIERKNIRKRKQAKT